MRKGRARSKVLEDRMASNPERFQEEVEHLVDDFDGNKDRLLNKYRSIHNTPSPQIIIIKKTYICKKLDFILVESFRLELKIEQ